MSIEDRFNRKSTNVTKVISSETSDSLNSEAESGENMDTVLKRADVFLPPLDYSSASNFAIYGSAEKYYEDAVKRVYLEYPYDGSQNEINQYLLSSSFLDHYVLDKRYPRTNGYVILSADGWGTQVASSGAYGATATASYEYISLSGAPDTTLSSGDPIANAFSGSHNQNNIYDLSNNRGSNLRLNPASGSTVEFWLKKTDFAPTKTGTEVIFDLWNYKDVNSVDYGRLRVEITGTVSNESPFRVTYISGTSSPTAPAGFINQILGTNINTASVADDTWNHYAITFLSSSNALTAKLYVNGDLNDTRTTGSTINEVTGGMVANIGALRTSPWAFGGSTYPTEGWGKLSASLDEFRYWKEARKAQDIGRNYWTQVRGGANTDDSNTTLGVYYKFNEGITGNSTLDSVVLDYSGRISNGSWTGYNASARNTGSAMVSSSAASTEFLDPIIYSSHPEVSSLLSDLKASGSYYDGQNNSSIYNTLPAWITEDDSSGDLKNLVQIVASYFDRLQNQIREIPRLKNIAYLSSSHSAPSFANSLVRERGMYTPNMFIDANILEEFLSRDEDREYNLDFREIKNRIYQNIYNNLVHINKSKGTENAYRNLIHCYGVDEELVRLNIYGNNVTHEFKDNFRSTVVSKNLIDFNSLSRNDATIYQMTASSNSNSVSFISGTADSDDLGKEDYLGFTLESEMLFPIKSEVCASTEEVPGNIITTVSLYGMHSADGSDAADTTWPTNDYADLRVQAIRAAVDSPDVRFRLTSSVATFPTLTSSLFKDVYDNNKWNFAVRVFNEKYPLGDVITGVSTSGSISTATRYKIEFFGVNSELDVVRNEFLLTGTLPNQGAVNLLRSDKRVFAGAHRTNFTGTVLQSSDVKLSAVRYWADIIPDEVIRAHSRDPENYGTLNPYRNAFASQTSMTGTYIPEIETLALNWSFENVTGSDADGFISIDDFSSGSADLQSRYGWYGNIAKAQHTAKGQFFPASDVKAVDRNYLNAARQSLPEVVQSSEMVNIVNQDEEAFDRDQRPISHFFSVEKSMYQVISDQILQSFATIVEFDNLIGDPVNRYRQDYKLMEKARALFFANIQNTPDLDRFIEFYKWIDSSLSVFMQQLVAVSSDTSDDIRNLVESHVLERNKYWTKFPTLERKEPSLEASATGAGATRSSPPRARDMLNPVLGRAPIPYVQNKHAPYWKTRAARDESGGLATGITAVDNDRQTIFESLKNQYDRDKKRPFVFNKDQVKIVHGGTNYSSAKRRDLIFNTTAVYGPRAVAGMPLNTVLMDDVDVLEFQNIDDVTDPNEKRKYSFRAKLRREDEAGSGQDNATYSSQLKGEIVAPFNLVSGTVTTGYNSLMVNSFKTGTILTNLHSDTYGNDNEIPMQGPFTEAHVGGHQSRHIEINRYNSDLSSTNNIDSPGNRPEAWLLFLGTRYGGGWAPGGEGTIVGFVGPDYPYPGGPYPYTANEFATRYRNVGAKRPVNIRNISYTTASTTIGNYRNSYEIVQTSGRSANNKHFIDSEGIQLPDLYNGVTSTLYSYLNTKHVLALSGTLGSAGVPGYRITTDSSLNNPTAFSFSMWLSCSNAATQGNDRYLISIGSDFLAAFGRAMYIDTSNKMILKLGYTSTDGVWTSDSAIWSSAGWHHFAMTYNDGDGDANFYINGVEAGGAFTTAPDGAFETPASDSTLLCRRNNTTGIITDNTAFYSGSIAEASYWNAKLTSTEVAEIYERGNVGDNEGPQDLTEHSAAANLVSWWRFGEDASDTVMLINDQVSSNDAVGIGTLGTNGMELEDLTAADLLVAGGGTFTTSTSGYLPQTTNVNNLIGIRPQTTNAGNYFGHIQTSPSTLSNRYSGSTSYSVRGRNSNKYIIAERFSAPGGPEVNSLGFLDIAAEEKSVYNALPFRNLSVRSSGSGESDTIRVQDQINERRGLRTLLSDHSGKFGHDKTFGSVSSDEYVQKPSLHKINRNTLKRIVFSGTGENQYGEAATGSFRDNAFISHEIPRTDLQYSWITASYELSRIYGHAWNDSVVSSSAGTAQAIEFASASIVTADNIQVDFANLNTLIRDDINVVTSIASSSDGEYRNTDLATINLVDSLNALNSHRNGAYGYSSWKQIRGGERAVARKQREKNIISHVVKNSLNYPLPVVGSDPEPRFGDVSQFVESPVVAKFSPVRQNVTVRGLTDKGIEVEESTDFYSSYANNLHAFNNSTLNNEYDARQDQIQAYDRLKDLYLSGEDLSDDSPISSFNFLSYKETVYPASKNAFSSSVRGRPEYANNFWRDIREERTQTGRALLVSASVLINNAQGSSGNTVTQSMWSLDADEDFLTRRCHGRVTSTGGPGVLQNSYSQVHSGTVGNITASVQYARRHTVDNIRSVVSPVGGLTEALPLGNSTYLTLFSMDTSDPEGQLFGGQALWEAATQSGKNPWYNSYDDYARHMRIIGKDYSIVPEFRISDHIKYYMSEKGGNFLADNASIFNMSGGLSDRDNSSEEKFYTTYSNSDFLKFFEIVKDDHNDIATPANITLQCSALLKFLPYDGFYPAARTVELGQQFSASYGQFVRLEGTHATGNVGMRSFMAPFYAPGLMYNTIKSGIAIDYPMMSASLGTHGADISKTPGNSSVYISGSAPNAGRFHYRIPFEALIEPEKYISDKDIIDLEPHPSCAVNVTASWDGRGDDIYKMMANNFFAEIPEFFLPEQQFSSLVSKPEGRFESVKSGEQYAARFKIYKSLNVATWRTGTLGYRNPFIPRNETDIKETFTMYSRPSAFGPPVGGGSSKTQLTSGDGVNPCFTPPYYYGEAWADLFFTAPRTSTTENPITLEEIFSPANLAVSYKRIGDTWKEMSMNTIMHSGNVEYNSMQVDASFNLFGKAQIKNLSYDPITGDPLVASDSDENVWVIQPKFETPMLNFSGASVTYPTFGSASVAFGMWHQYGQLPDDPSKGIFFQIGDLPDNYIENALNGTPAETGSLVDLVGFSAAPRRLGGVSDTKVIKEAVVAIPFIEQSGERKFFSIDRAIVSEALGEVRAGKKTTNGSIASMIDSMTRYVFPPALDFITNPDAVEPYAAYVFEFEQALNQDDLVDIWQNLPPRSAFSFDPESYEFVSGNGLPSEEISKQVSINHPLLASELLGSDIPSRVQWMVFKVKQKANKSYFSKVIADEVNQIGNFDRTVAVEVGRKNSGKAAIPDYSYNWPYDFFSLVELVKIDAEVTIEGNSADPVGGTSRATTTSGISRG